MKVKVPNIQKLIDKKIDNVNIKTVEKQVKKMWLDRVVSSARKGKDIDGEKLPNITDKWRVYRNKLASKNGKGQNYTTSNQSRMTFMGDLLNGIKIDSDSSSWKSMRKLRFVMYITGTHRPVIGLIGKEISKGESLSTIYTGLKSINSKYGIMRYNKLITNKAIMILKREMRRKS